MKSGITGSNYAGVILFSCKEHGVVNKDKLFMHTHLQITHLMTYIDRARAVAIAEGDAR